MLLSLWHGVFSRPASFCTMRLLVHSASVAFLSPPRCCMYGGPVTEVPAVSSTKHGETLQHGEPLTIDAAQVSKGIDNGFGRCVLPTFWRATGKMNRSPAQPWLALCCGFPSLPCCFWALKIVRRRGSYRPRRNRAQLQAGGAPQVGFHICMASSLECWGCLCPFLQ